MAEGKAPPVYVIPVQLNASGVFTGACMAVSMRRYREEDAARVRASRRASAGSMASRWHGAGRGISIWGLRIESKPRLWTLKSGLSR